MTPHNVMLTYDGSVKILDFGIAKLNASLIETQTGVIKGKLRYMPPEQISGDQVDRRADVFAVGVMLWEAATNIRMWGKMSEAAIMNAVLKGDVPSPREENPTLDPELERIIMKALAYEPDDRYASAADLQTDIDAYLGSMSTAVTNREIGAFVTKQFEAARSETKKIVEEQLKQSSLSAAESKGLISFPPGPLPPRATTYTASTTLGTNGTSLNGAQGGPRRLAAAAAATLLVAAAASAAVWKISAAPAEHEAARGASTPSASTAPVAPPKDSAPAEVLLRITAFPVSARLFLDDRELPGNPYSSSVKFDKSPHAIRAEAEGHVSSSVAVSFDRDRDVVITLETQKPVVAPKKQTTTRRAPSEPASTPPAPNCNPPYFIEDGIKKFKPGCLR
jgi:serine/threonine-protein kinase